MNNRFTTRTITFRHPFAMVGLDGWQPAGSYVVETEEKLLQALSFPAWCRLHTAIRLPQRPGVSMIEQVVPIDPEAIEAALAADILAG
jgi:hypothetical protein